MAGERCWRARRAKKALGWLSVEDSAIQGWRSRSELTISTCCDPCRDRRTVRCCHDWGETNITSSRKRVTKCGGSIEDSRATALTRTQSVLECAGPPALWRALGIRKAPEDWSIDSLRSPFGQPVAVYLRCAPVPKHCRARMCATALNSVQWADKTDLFSTHRGMSSPCRLEAA
jgi:hypothetical protein